MKNFTFQLPLSQIRKISWHMISIKIFIAFLLPDWIVSYLNMWSWSFDPHAIFTDAFTISWSEFKPYIFPPFSLIGKVMLKIMGLIFRWRHQNTNFLQANWYCLFVADRHDDKITLADSVEIPLSSNAFLRQHKRLNALFMYVGR
jgi:hypothetical protein